MVSSEAESIIYIKNMVCDRCIRVVKEELEKLDLEIKSIKLGEVELKYPTKNNPMKQISQILENNGFELLEDKKAKIIERIKNIVIDLFHHENSDILESKNLSELIEKELNIEYNYLSSLFSKTEGITIEQYTILQKVEKVKELLKYGEYTLGEIAYSLGYSSVQHLSGQFKQVTGLTTSQFKKNIVNLRKPLDSIRD